MHLNMVKKLVMARVNGRIFCHSTDVPIIIHNRKYFPFNIKHKYISTNIIDTYIYKQIWSLCSFLLLKLFINQICVG